MPARFARPVEIWWTMPPLVSIAMIFCEPCTVIQSRLWVVSDARASGWSVTVVVAVGDGRPPGRGKSLSHGSLLVESQAPPWGSTLPRAPAPYSVNHSLPSGPVTMSVGPARGGATPAGFLMPNWGGYPGGTAPCVFTAQTSLAEAPTSAIHKLPSGPVVMAAGMLPGSPLVYRSSAWLAGLKRPTCLAGAGTPGPRSSPASVYQRLPSGPVVIPRGSLDAVPCVSPGGRNSLIVPVAAAATDVSGPLGARAVREARRARIASRGPDRVATAARTRLGMRRLLLIGDEGACFLLFRETPNQPNQNGFLVPSSPFGQAEEGGPWPPSS